MWCRWLWEKGTLIATAVTPIVVAVVSELLHKPVDRIGAVGMRRPTSGGTAIGEPGPPRPADEPFDPLSPAERVEVHEVSGDRHVYYERPRRRLDRRQLKIALVTGVLGFVLAAAIVTASELALFGKSVSEGDRRTTFVGGAAATGARSETSRRSPARRPASRHRRLHPPRPRALANRPPARPLRRSPPPAPAQTPTPTP